MSTPGVPGSPISDQEGFGSGAAPIRGSKPSSRLPRLQPPSCLFELEPPSRGRLARTWTHVLFAAFLFLTLATPSWRVGPFTWLPVVRFPMLGGRPAELGLMSLLPGLVVAGWVVVRVRERSPRTFHWGRPGISLPLMGLTVLILAGLDRAITWRTAVQVVGLGLFWLTYLFMLNERPRLTVPLALVVLVQGGVAVGQFLRQRDLGLAFLGELALDPAVSGISVLWARDRRWLRGYGLTAHPNTLGAMLAILLLLLLPALWRARGWRRAARKTPPGRGLELWKGLELGKAGRGLELGRTRCPAPEMRPWRWRAPRAGRSARKTPPGRGLERGRAGRGLELGKAGRGLELGKAGRRPELEGTSEMLPWWAVVLTIVISVGLVGLLAGFSRASWLAFGMGVCTWVVRAGWDRLRAARRQQERAARPRALVVRLPVQFVIPLLFVVLFLFAYRDLVVSRFVGLDTPIEARSLNDRRRDAELALELAAGHPWRGVGAGNYVPAVRQVTLDSRPVHSVPLLVAAELGVPGAALWAWVVVAGLWAAGITATTGASMKSGGRPPAIVEGCPMALGTWVAMLSLGMFDVSLWVTTSWRAAILFAVLAARVAVQETRRA
jgi:hypothetical protein